MLDPNDYRALIQKYRSGALAQVDPSAFSKPVQAFYTLLLTYSRRQWPEFQAFYQTNGWENQPDHARILGDLYFLRANARFVMTDYDGAARDYQQSLDHYSDFCLLYTPRIARYNQAILYQFQKTPRFSEMLPSLRRSRSEAVQAKDDFLLGMILNSYGNHYASRGRFKKALSLYKQSLLHQEKDFKFTNYLDTLGNAVRSSVRIGAFKDAEKMMQKLNAYVLGARDNACQERYDSVYADYLNAVERPEESLIHLGFSESQASPRANAQMFLLKARLLAQLGKDEAPQELEKARRLIQTHDLDEELWIELYLAESLLLMRQGDMQGSYQCILKADSLGYWHRSPYLRARVMIQKSRLNHRQGQKATAARLFMDVLEICVAQNFDLLVREIVRALDTPALLERLEERERRRLLDIVASVARASELKHTRRAAEEIQAFLAPQEDAPEAGPGPKSKPQPKPAPQSSLPETAIIEVNERDSMIYLLKNNTKSPIAKTHLMSGKLLAEFLRSPNRDLSLEQLHLKLWGGPIRNESHVQKLKTLVSRLRTELRAKGFPAELESREYATYRIVLDPPVSWI